MPHTGNSPQSQIMVGQRIGRGVVQRLGLRRGKRKRLAAELLCDCGTTYVSPLIHLRGGGVQSCGCLRREWGRVNPVMTATTHGMSDHPLYPTWYKMVDRCTNPGAPRYKDYGGRGIQVFGPWRNDPAAFIDWVEQNLGPKPGPGYSLDRTDNDGNYEPGNLDWATWREQFENSRHVRDPGTGRFVPS